MISSLEEAIAVLSRYRDEECTVWFSIAACGLFSKGEGIVESVSEVGLDLATPRGAVLVLWGIFEPAEIEYFEPSEIPPEDRPEGLEIVDSFWRFTSKGEAPRMGCFILTALRR